MRWEKHYLWEGKGVDPRVSALHGKWMEWSRGPASFYQCCSLLPALSLCPVLLFLSPILTLTGSSLWDFPLKLFYPPGGDLDITL